MIVPNVLSRIRGGFGGLVVVAAALAVDARAQDANQGPALTVRDVVVFEGSNYENTLNARSRVDSTLPRALAGRRPTSKDFSHPMPLGLITFEGQAVSDIDVLIEYQGRLMAHVPTASSRTKRLLWGRLSLTTEPVENALQLPADHWLTQIDFSSRLVAQGPSTTASPYLLYDIEHDERPLATISLDGDRWSAKNTGRDPIFHAAVFRPTEDGRYTFGVLDTVEAYDAGKSGETPQKPAPDPRAVKAVGQIVGGLMNAVVGNPEQQPAVVTPAAKSKVEKSPGTLAEWTFSEPLDGVDAVGRYAERFEDLGDVERTHLANVLLGRALKDTSATFVYALDAKTLERIVPIEVTPQPDRLVRAGIVIVTDADPSLSVEVDRLIALLGHESWQQREAADARLRELGRITERNLQAAATNSDAEIAYRAKRIIADLKAQKQ